MAEADSSGCCAHCGRQITPRMNKTGTPSRAVRRYCDSRCAIRARDARRPSRDRKGKRTYRDAECVVCGKGFQSYASTGSPGGWTQCCSVRCSNKSRTIAAHERARVVRLVVAEVRALHRIAAYVERPRLTKRPCGGCGTPMVGVLEWRRTCESCKSEARRLQAKKYRTTAAGRAQRHRDKARRRTRLSVAAEAIDPIAVFDRDKWRCRLCGVSTPRRLRGGTDDRAPELDHIVPLALGGTHTWGNVQCACRKCNGQKGATAQGQLGLPLAA